MRKGFSVVRIVLCNLLPYLLGFGILPLALQSERVLTSVLGDAQEPQSRLPTKNIRAASCGEPDSLQILLRGYKLRYLFQSTGGNRQKYDA